MEKASPQQVSQLIRERRSVFPPMYREQAIPRAILEEALENANWAPTHRFTEPWRFKVFTGAALQSLSDYMGDYYEQHTPPEKFSAVKLKKIRKNPLRAGAVIAICMQRDPEARVPEWEEIAAVACAVQNISLSLHAHDIGSYWSSPGIIIKANAFLGLAEGERCLGLLYMGYYDDPGLEGKRTPIAPKVEWRS
ncbi:MAG: nitroreductase [Bacteroidota bacterium]